MQHRFAGLMSSQRFKAQESSSLGIFIKGYCGVWQD